MMGARISWGWTALALGLLGIVFFYAPSAMAGTVGSYSCVGGVASGSLYDSGASCPTTLNTSNFFSFIICNLEQLSSNVLGSMFCGMITNLTPAVWGFVTLAILFFAISFTIGLTPATGKEAIMFVIKVGFITAFATNADVIIGVTYNFLINLINDGVAVVLSGIVGGTYSGPSDVFSLLDDLIKQFFDYATDSASRPKGDAACKNALFAVLASITVAFPLISYIMLMFVGRFILTLYRTMFGYMYAIIGITFLIVLSPFFVTCYLFKQTRSFFDKWLSHLLSFTAQIILLFAMLGFVFALRDSIADVTSNISNVTMYQSKAAEGHSLRLPWQYCTVCDFKVVHETTGVDLTDPNDPDYTQYGELQCKDAPPVAIEVNAAISPNAAGQAQTILLFSTTSILKMLVMVILVDQLLQLIPLLAQRLSASAYTPQLGGGGGHGPHQATFRSLGETQIERFSKGFKEAAQGERSNSVTSTIKGVQRGTSNLSLTETFGRWLKDPTQFGQ